MKYHYITQVIIDLFGFHTKEPFIVQEIVIRILVATLRTQDLKNFRNIRKMLKLGGDVAQFPLSSLGVKLLQQRSKMTIKQISELSGAVQFCFFFFLSPSYISGIVEIMLLVVRTFIDSLGTDHEVPGNFICLDEKILSNSTVIETPRNSINVTFENSIPSTSPK